MWEFCWINGTGAIFFPTRLLWVFPLKNIIAQNLQTHLAKSLTSGVAATDPPNFTVERVRFLFRIQEVSDLNTDQDLLS
jgi:hypothetical protein